MSRLPPLLKKEINKFAVQILRYRGYNVDDEFDCWGSKEKSATDALKIATMSYDFWSKSRTPLAGT